MTVKILKRLRFAVIEKQSTNSSEDLPLKRGGSESERSGSQGPVVGNVCPSWNTNETKKRNQKLTTNKKNRLIINYA